MANQPITVLIEQPDFVPFASPLRRSSLTPGLGLMSNGHSGHHPYGHGHALALAHGHGYTGGGGVGGPGNSPHNSIHSISGVVPTASGSTGDGISSSPSASMNSISPSTTTGRSVNRNSISAAGGGNHSAKEWNRRQRTSTTFHASIDVPDSLLAALSSNAIVNIQPALSPLPISRPLIVLIQLNDYIPQELSTTPSTVCFPPNATPTKQSVQRAIQPLKSTLGQLEKIGAGRGEVALLLYSDNAHLPPEIPQAAFQGGAHGLLTPPFTPDSVQKALKGTLEMFEKVKETIQSAVPDKEEALPLVSERRPTHEQPRERRREHHKWGSLDSFTLDSSSSHNSYENAINPIQQEGGEDIVDPLDTSKRRKSALLINPNSILPNRTLDDNDVGFTYATVAAYGDTIVPFPPPDYPLLARRASVDIGALRLALPREFSPTSPAQQPVYSMSSPRDDRNIGTINAPNVYTNVYNSAEHDPQYAQNHPQYSPNHPHRYLSLHQHNSASPSTTSMARDVSGWGWAGFDIDPTFLHASSSFSSLNHTHGVVGFGPGPWGRRGTVVPGRAKAAAAAAASAAEESARKQSGGTGNSKGGLGCVKSAGGKGGGAGIVNAGGMFDVDEEEGEGDGLGVADLLLAMHLHGTAALENAAALSVVQPPPPPSSTAFSSTTSTNPNSQSFFPSSASTTNLSGIVGAQAAGGGGGAAQRRQSSPTQSTAPNAFSAPSIPPLPPIPALPLPSILTATPRTLSRLRALLSSWHFEPYLLSPPETLLCVQLVFEALLGGLKLGATASASEPSDSPASPSPLPKITMADHLVPFLTDLMRLYRRENRYHSFVHALDVLQAVYTFLELQGRVESVAVAFLDGERESDYGHGRRGGAGGGVVLEGEGGKYPKVDVPSLLGLLSDDDLFLLCLAAIGHDVGHPGNSNAFLKNAQAPLSKLYEHKSALERMHCTLLLRLLWKHGMGHLISLHTPRGRDGRWLIVGTILATDMSWHFEWVERFGRAMKDRRATYQQNQGRSVGGSPELVVNSSGSGAWVVVEQDQEAATPGDTNDPDGPEQLSQEEVDREDRLFMCQAMMKCADISNPCRPHNISRHWSTVLLEEWAAQALLERHLGLPVSVVADANEKVQCVGQVSFIKLFTQPLFDIVADALPGLSVIAKQCTENRILWENRLANFEEITTAQAQSPSRVSTSSSSSKSAQQMIRPIPLALPILPSMTRYAKTVFPLSLPSLRTKKLPSAARALASMSPWHSVTQGKKKSTAMTASTTTGTSNSNTSGTSGRTSGSGRVWSHSRPESFSSTSTLSSVGAGGGGGGGGNGLSPTTPTSSSIPSNSVYGRSPVSPLMSPFSMSMAVSKSSVSGTGGAATSGPLPPSVWDVDPMFAEALRREVRRAWEIRDGRSRKRGRGRGRLEEGFLGGELEDGEGNTYPLRRWSLDPVVG